MSDVGVSDGIRRMYEKVALRYDLFNRVATFGLDGGWRNRAAGFAPAEGGKTVLDVCAGTGDMTRGIASRLGAGSLVLALDFSPQMLSICRDKISGTAANAVFALGRGEVLPISSGKVDAAFCAFALRNLESVMDGFLKELLRVLRPGGKAVLLETSRPTAPFLRQAYMFYLKNIVPLEGRLITGHGPAYRYLADSVLQFSTPDEFCRRLEAAGFSRIGYRSLSCGIATIHTAHKPGGRGGEDGR